MSPACASSRQPSAESGRARDPQDRLQVAEPAGTLLHVRLEVVGRVVILEVSLLLLQHLAFVERRHVHRLGELARERAMERARAGDEAMLEQARANRDVGLHLVDALADRAHAVTGLEPDVPEETDQPLDERGARAIERTRQQDQHVDVRMREELAAAVAADGDQCGRRRRAELAPDGGDHAIDEPGVLAQQARRVGALEERRAQRGTARAHLVLPAQRGVHRREVRGYQIRGFCGHGGKPRVSSVASGRARHAAGAGAPADSVSTS